MVLIKVVLESIPIYWMSLAWIANGIMEEIRRLGFIFLWFIIDDKNEGVPWVKWQRLAFIEEEGGWV